MTRKLLVLLIILSLALVACGGQADDSDTSDDNTDTVTETSNTDETTDTDTDESDEAMDDTDDSSDDNMDDSDSEMDDVATIEVDSSDPVSVTRAFWTEIYAGNGELAATYVCEIDIAGIDNEDLGMMFGAVNLGPVEIDVSGLEYELISQEGGNAEVEVTGEILFGVAGTEQMTPADFDSVTMTLIDEDGWKICTDTN
ncbi:MAG: hypothetical protein AAF846_25585 [Chloroflexota bacterium]